MASPEEVTKISLTSGYGSSRSLCLMHERAAVICDVCPASSIHPCITQSIFGGRTEGRMYRSSSTRIDPLDDFFEVYHSREHFGSRICILARVDMPANHTYGTTKLRRGRQPGEIYCGHGLQTWKNTLLDCRCLSTVMGVAWWGNVVQDYFRRRGMGRQWYRYGSKGNMCTG